MEGVVGGVSGRTLSGLTLSGGSRVLLKERHVEMEENTR